MGKITQRERDVWRTAITLASNICVRRSNYCNDDDGPLDAVHEAADCAREIALWADPTDEQLATMLLERDNVSIDCVWEWWLS